LQGDGKFTRRSTNFTRAQVAAQMSYFWLVNDDVENKTSYSAFGQQFYQWLMQPIEADLKQAKVQTLIYVLDQGLRQIPVATMQRSTNNWVGNDYQMSVVASLGLLKPKISPLRNQTTVAMGVDTFKTLQPLPAVGTELDLIGRENPIGRKFLNQDFTFANLQQQITDRRPGILHLATHAQFNSGIPSKSYIQLWDRPLGIDQLKQLGLEQAGIELLVLSACNTASGSREAELGFTGMASLSGVNTVLGSIWSVSDLGTLAFMTEFYGQLKNTPSRVEALRQTQQAMRSGQVRLDRDYLVTSQGRFPVPPKIQRQGSLDFVHPFYWAGFTMVGNPW
jgi:CHAT domain-containing protein